MRKKLFAGCLPLLLVGIFILGGCPNNDPLPRTPTVEAPADVEAHPAGGQVRLTWTHPDDDALFEVSYGTVASDAFAGDALVRANEIVITGLTNDTEYHFRVRAQRVGVWSDFSEVVRATPTAALAPPAMPENVRIAHGGLRGQLIVTWNHVPGALNYRVKFGETDDPDTATLWVVDDETDDVEIMATNVTITGLTDNLLYYVWVWAFNDFDDGSYGPAAMVWGMTLGVPLTPDIFFDMDRATMGMIPLRWVEDPSVERYEVRYARTDENRNADTALPWTMGITRTGVDIGGGNLEDDTEYTVWVRGINAIGNSPWAQAIVRTIETQPPPEAPRLFVSNPGGHVTAADPTASGVTTGSVRQQVMVHWEHMPDALRYEIAWSFDPDEEFENISAARRYFVSTPTTQAPVFSSWNNLGAEFIIHVRAWGREAGGTAVIRTTPTGHGTLVGVPSVGVDAREMGQLIVRWAEVPEATGYEFYWNYTFDLGTATRHTVAADLDARRIQFDVPNYTRRFFWVRAILPPLDDSPDDDDGTDNGTGNGTDDEADNEVERHSEWGIAHGRSRAAPTHDLQVNNWAPRWREPNTAAMRALTETISVSLGRSFNNDGHPGAHDIEAATRWGGSFFSGNSRVIGNTVYLLTPEADPRVVLGLRMGAPRPEALELNPALADQLIAQTGRPWFDQVILFNAGIRFRDCLNDTPSVDGAVTFGNYRLSHVNGRPDNHMCNRSGLHLHFDNAIQYVLDNRDRYIRPLQDAGIRVLVSILGDWGGITFNTFGDWPFEDVSPVRGPGRPGQVRGGPGGPPPPHFRDADGNPHYPFHNAARETFLIEIKNMLNYYGLDGVCLDEEWAHAKTAEYDVVTPGGSTTWLYSTMPSLWNYYTNEHQATDRRTAAWARLGKNAAQFVVALRETIGPGFIIHLYEFGGFGSATQATHFPRHVAHPFTGETVRVSDFYCMSTASVWPSHVPNSRIGTPAYRYAATAIDLFDGPPYARPLMTGTGTAATTAVGRARQMLPGAWGWLTYYGIHSRYLAVQGGRRDAPVGQPAVIKSAMNRMFNWTSGAAQNRGPEVYLSVFSQVLFGADVIWDPAAYVAVGVDHLEVHAPWLDRRVQPWVPRELFPDIE